MQNNINLNIYKISAIVLAVFAVLAPAFGTYAGDEDYGYDYSSPSYYSDTPSYDYSSPSYYDTSSYDYSSPSYYSDTPSYDYSSPSYYADTNYYDYSSPSYYSDTPSYDYESTYTAPTSYDYYTTPSYDYYTTGSTGSNGCSSYYGCGGSSNYTTPSRSTSGSGSNSAAIASANASASANVRVNNTNTNNNINNNTNNNVINNNNNNSTPTQPIVYQPPVYPPYQQNNLSVSCYANNTSPTVGQSVTFYANASGGNGNYTYSWSNSSNGYNNGSSMTQTFYNTGTQYETVTVYSNGQTASNSCQVYVGGNNGNVIVYGGGSNINSGGLTSGVFLSQVPYTGLKGGFNVTLFVIGLFFWSAVIAWFIFRKKEMREKFSRSEIIARFKQQNLKAKVANSH